MGSRELKIAVFGLGNVGKHFLSILGNQSDLIWERTGVSIRITAAADSTSCRIFPGGISPLRLLEAKSRGELSVLGRSADRNEITGSGTDIIVDMSTASPDGVREMKDYIAAMEEGSSIVTANKSPLANHWVEIMDVSGKTGREILYEATVAGGVPLFSMIRHACGPSRIISFRGIVSLTANFVMRQIQSGKTFEEAVQVAKERGIAETNYTDDTDGVDGARKTVILANALFGTRLRLKDFSFRGVPADGLSSIKSGTRLITDINVQDRSPRIFSGPVDLEDSDYLLSLGTMSLGYEVETQYNGTLRVSSISDGPGETAAAVVNDLMILSSQKFQGKH